MTKPITDTMHHIGNGFFISSASDEFQKLVKKVNESGRAGKIDLTISVKKLVKNGAMQITGKVKATMPAEEPMETVLFATDVFGLQIDHPNQKGLDLKVITEEKKELKSLEANG
ncbi:MAG: hypothetical protein E6Q97_33675 [Desulfurellales bacterium]|nr:MAG: hypothetical protein E6Q97_33675 [Desulfurellales bacterium]